MELHLGMDGGMVVEVVVVGVRGNVVVVVGVRGNVVVVVEVVPPPPHSKQREVLQPLLQQ